MADLTLTGYPLNDGFTAMNVSVNRINQWFYDDTTLASTLRVVNGGLDEDNMSSTFEPGPQHTQRGSHVLGFEASGTANLDFAKHMFNQYEFSETGGWSLDAADPFLYIPGGCRTWYQPWSGYALLQWSIMWQNTNVNSESLRSCVFAMLDGSYLTSQYRAMSRIGSAAGNPVGYKKTRTWTGHAVVPVSSGHRSAGLAILADYRIFLTRVHSVSFTAMPFKRGSSV